MDGAKLIDETTNNGRAKQFATRKDYTLSLPGTNSSIQFQPAAAAVHGPPAAAAAAAAVDFRELIRSIRKTMYLIGMDLIGSFCRQMCCVMCKLIASSSLHAPTPPLIGGGFIDWLTDQQHDH
ncbi:hypothetical protein GPALN_004134 [Globodera pallida]|nr:hypothetical protein GPALN_004134 [Globodera pallida]